MLAHGFRVMRVFRDRLFLAPQNAYAKADAPLLRSPRLALLWTSLRLGPDVLDDKGFTVGKAGNELKPKVVCVLF